MTPDKLYHYTDRESAEKIVQDGVIRATTKTLHRDMEARDEGLETPPHVWLTINPILDGPILVKMQLAGLGIEQLARVVLPGDFCDVGLADYTEAVGIPHEWWAWVVKTGMMAGSDYTTWRLHDRDVPRKDWLAVEKFVGIGEDGMTRWSPL